MKLLILSLVLINFILYYIIFDFLNQKILVAFLDIGQGSSILIKNKNNIFLYDTGKYPNLLFKEIDQLIPFYNKKIDILFLSHSDKDHIEATFELLKRYKIRLVGINGQFSEDENYHQLLQEIKKKKIPIISFRRHFKIYDNHFNFLILHPEKDYRKDNDDSLVIKLIGHNSYLLTGDIEKEAILSLINCCSKFLKADYFLVPHHGSKSSLNEDFYSLVKPKISIIQVGKNYYGHPHKETLKALANISQIWRTDLNKSLIIEER
jgi:competence protein ComEC